MRYFLAGNFLLAPRRTSRLYWQGKVVYKLQRVLVLFSFSSKDKTCSFKLYSLRLLFPRIDEANNVFYFWVLLNKYE